MIFCRKCQIHIKLYCSELLANFGFTYLPTNLFYFGFCTRSHYSGHRFGLEVPWAISTIIGMWPPPLFLNSVGTLAGLCLSESPFTLHHWGHTILSPLSEVSSKLTVSPISKLLTYPCPLHVRKKLACDSFCFLPLFFTQVIFYLSQGTAQFSSSQEYLLLIHQKKRPYEYNFFFSSKRMNTFKSNKLTVAEYTETSIHSSSPCISPILPTYRF